MKLQAAIRRVREGFKFKLNESDISLIINLLTDIDESARQEAKQEQFKALQDAIQQRQF